MCSSKTEKSNSLTLLSRRPTSACLSQRSMKDSKRGTISLSLYFSSDDTYKYILYYSRFLGRACLAQRSCTTTVNCSYNITEQNRDMGGSGGESIRQANRSKMLYTNTFEERREWVCDSLSVLSAAIASSVFHFFRSYTFSFFSLFACFTFASLSSGLSLFVSRSVTM